MRVFLAMMTALLLAPAAMAQSGQAIAAADGDFVRQASSSGLAEIALGKLAADRASSNDVKKFAARMIDDHTHANEALGKLAGSKGLQVAVAPEAPQQQNIDRLSLLEGPDFDRAYSDVMVHDQKLVTGLYELEATKGEDAQVREFARNTLPMLKEHTKLADDLPPL